MTTLFKDKVILIYGEVSDLSMEIIHSFLEEMATVIFPAKSLHQVDVVKSFKNINQHKNFISLLVDVKDFDKVMETCETITDKFGKIDIAVQIPEFSNHQTNLTEASLDEWNSMTETDMLPFFVGARIVLNMMKGNLSGMFVHISDSRFFEHLSSCALARIAFTTRIEMSKIFAEEAHRHGIRYYHFWAQNPLPEQASFVNISTTAMVNAEALCTGIKNLYQKETYSTTTALQSFPKHLLHENV